VGIFKLQLLLTLI